MIKKACKNLVASLLAVCLFAGLMVTTKVSAAGPDASQKKGAATVTLGEVLENRKTVGSTIKDTKSTYFKFKTKRRYNVDITITAYADVSKSFDVQVWNSKGTLIKSFNQTSSGWKYNAGVTKNSFSVKKLKKGTYYIEIKEKGTNANVNYSVKVVPVMIEKVTNVSAKQVSAGAKQVKVTWTPLKGEAISGYKIYRATKKNGKYKLVKEVKGINTSSCTDKKNIKPGKTYYYIVKAYYYQRSIDLDYYSKASAKAKVVTTK